MSPGRLRRLLLLAALSATWLLPGATAEAATRARADLSVSSVSGSPGRIAVDSLLSVTARVSNRGSAVALPGEVRFLLSADRRFGRGDASLPGLVESGRLARGRTATLKARLVVPGGLRPGPRYLIACADAARAIREGNERNNCRASVGRIEILPRGATPPAPSTTQLIEAALAARRISPETALLYRVYAAHGDPRLPLSYQGAQRGDDELLMADVSERWRKLSARTRRLLGPFLLRPMQPGSWWARRYAPAGSARRSKALRCGRWEYLNEDWSYVNAPTDPKAPTVPVRVWYQDRYGATEATKARALAGLYAKIYPRLSAYMGRKAISDGGGERLFGFCLGSGGSSDLDVQLIDLSPPTTGLTMPYNGCDGGASYIDLDRTNAGAADAAHELMHVLQYTINAVDSCAKLEWWMDATAEWANQKLAPKEPNQTEHRHMPAFTATLNRPLETNESSNPFRRYGAGLFAYYLAEKVDADAIRRTWDAIASKSTLQAINDEIGGFPKRWPEFALLAVNEPGLDFFQTSDGIDARALSSQPNGTVDDKDIALSPGAAGEQQVKIPVNLEQLSARYYRFDVTDTNIRSIVLNVPAPTFGFVSVEVLGKHAGKWRRIAMFDDNQLICPRSVPSEDFQQIMLVYANASMTTGWQAPASEQPEVSVSNVGCRYRGSITHTWRYQSQPPSIESIEKMSANLEFAYIPANYHRRRLTPVSGTISAEYSWTGPHQGQRCSESGQASTTLPDPAVTGWLEPEFTAPDPGERRQFRAVGARWNGTFPGPSPCLGGRQLPYWWHVGGRHYIAPDGSISGSYFEGELDGSYLRQEWNLVPIG